MQYNMKNNNLEENDEVLHSLNMGCYVDYENNQIVFKDFKYDNVLRLDSNFQSDELNWKFLNEIVNRIQGAINPFFKINYIIKQYIDFGGPEKSLAEKYNDMYNTFNIYPTATQNLDDYMRFREWLEWRFQQIQMGE